MRVPYLLTSPTLGPAQRWRLAASLYEQRLSILKGSGALFAVLVIAAGRTGAPVFAGLAAACVVVLALRLVHVAWFWRRTGAAPPGGGRTPEGRSPEAWARDFTAGAAATALLWGATDLLVLLGFDDQPMQFMLCAVQGGWVGGSAIRNAASPAVVYCQILLTSLLTLLGLALRQPGFVQVLMPFIALQVVTCLSITRFGGRQLVTLLESEQRLAASNDRLLQLSATDGLTGIANRRTLDARLDAVWASAARETSDVALVLLDVDHFKRYNDRYGHLRGDECLCRIARCVADALARESDLAARYGGEEFAALLPGTTEAGARIVAERIRAAVLAAAMPHADSPHGLVTVSLGVASMAPARGDAPDALIALADGALYRAKQAGRNQLRGAAEERALGQWRAHEGQADQAASASTR